MENRFSTKKLISFLLIFLTLFKALEELQAADTETKEIAPSTTELHPKAPDKVDVRPSARDDEIRKRILGILNATGWFSDSHIEVKEGVVFLYGTTHAEEFKLWAGNLAANTQDVSAVVNKIKVIEHSIWDFQPTLVGLREQWKDLTKILPALIFALLIFALTLFFVWTTAFLTRKGLKNHVSNPLLRDVIARTLAFLVFLFGLYIIFKLLGLTTIALTILGGTGILGIILGIAFKDITENLLASIVLSIHRPFQRGDFIEIDGISGYVQKLTSRSTVLLAPKGNYVEIPNATVFKTKIYNYTINPNERVLFSIPIGAREDISKMQKIALQILEEHPAVLDDPEPWVLVENIERLRVILSVYFWINTKEHSALKTKSSVMRLISYAFDKERSSKEARKTAAKKSKDGALLATDAEQDLRSESDEIKDQAKLSRSSEKEEKNLLDPNPNSNP